jgi:hypothetical protein
MIEARIRFSSMTRIAWDVDTMDAFCFSRGITQCAICCRPEFGGNDKAETRRFAVDRSEIDDAVGADIAEGAEAAVEGPAGRRKEIGELIVGSTRLAATTRRI